MPLKIDIYIMLCKSQLSISYVSLEKKKKLLFFWNRCIDFYNLYCCIIIILLNVFIIEQKLKKTLLSPYLPASKICKKKDLLAWIKLWKSWSVISNFYVRSLARKCLTKKPRDLLQQALHVLIQPQDPGLEKDLYRVKMFLKMKLKMGIPLMMNALLLHLQK